MPVWRLGEGRALGNMGLGYADLGEYPKAIELHEQHLDIARRIGDVLGEGNALGNMGVAYAKLKEPEKARQCFIGARTLFRRLGLDHMVAQVEQMAESGGIKI